MAPQFDTSPDVSMCTQHHWGTQRRTSRPYFGSQARHSRRFFVIARQQRSTLTTAFAKDSKAAPRNCNNFHHLSVTLFDVLRLKAHKQNMALIAPGSPTSSTETNRIRLVLSGMQNRTSGPYLAAINRILFSLIFAERLVHPTLAAGAQLQLVIPTAESLAAFCFFSGMQRVLQPISRPVCPSRAPPYLLREVVLGIDRERRIALHLLWMVRALRDALAMLGHCALSVALHADHIRHRLALARSNGSGVRLSGACF
jgi:hypothetical protein